VLAEDGRKMSKRLKNYPDPEHIMDEYGADALRLTLLSSPVVRAEDLRFSESGVREIMRTVILPLWNAHSFFATYASVDKWTPPTGIAAPPPAPASILDQWILSQLEGTAADVREAMDNYDLQRAAIRFSTFIEDLTNWYIRRSRRRFWKSQNDIDKGQAYATLHYVLVTFSQIAAPFIPFLTEAIYRNLRTPQMPESVHLCDLPDTAGRFCNPSLDRCMRHTMCAVSLGRYLRTQAALRVRQPLRKAVLVSADEQVRRDLAEMRDVVAEELNVKQIDIRADEEELVHLSAKANFKELGPRLGSRMKAAAQAISKLEAADIRQLRAGETLQIDIGDDTPLTLSENDIIVQRDEREGLTVANEGAITVALDTRLDAALTQEGWARELVSRIQNMRKEAGLQVSDRIRIQYELPPAAAEALATFQDYIANETLAANMEPAALQASDEVEINSTSGRLRIAKA
jgi:isoleucyl-tRNA synthetase